MGQSSEGLTPVLRAFVDELRSTRWAGDIWTLMLALAVTTVTCLASGALKSMAGEIAPIWLTNAVLLAQMMVARPRQRYWVLAGGVLGNLAANFYVGESLGVSFSYSFADIGEVLVAFLFAPRISTVAELIRPKPLAKFLTGGVLFAPIASGLVAMALLRGQLSGHLLPDLGNWFVSDALSLAIFTPAAVVFWTGEVTHLLRADRRRKTAFLLLLVCLVTTGVFGQNHFTVLYLALPPIVLLAFLADLAGVMVGLLLCLAIAVSFTMHGAGPLWIFPHHSMQGRIFALQLFLVAALGIALPISATQAQRNRLLAMLREGERRYRILAENASDIVMSMALDGKLTYASPRATAVMGTPPESLIGVYYPDLVLPDDRDALAAAIENLAMGATEASQVSRFRRPDGQLLWLETSFRPVVDPYSGTQEALTATVRDVTERKAAEQRLADERMELHGLAFRDGLTGLFNRRHFDRELESQWRPDARADKRGFVAVVMVDVDAYKGFNDHYGHQAGDECLRAIAQTIAASVKRPTDVVARYGGEEFALVLKDTDHEGAVLVGERIGRAVEGLQIRHLACGAGIVTVSCGVAAQRPCDGGDGSHLVAAADRALYAAKRRGRNQTCMAGAEPGDGTGV
jgi:diguanylate cyclase (GGDEF)-like protein/PAS domain S-box-containing protein